MSDTPITPLKNLESDVIGIDLGTTFSVVGLWRNGRVEIIANAEGKYITPSMVSYTSDEILIGDGAKQKLASNPENTVYDMKRLIGKKFGDEAIGKNMKYWTFKVSQDGNRPVVDVKHKKQVMRVYPENISTLVLKKMKETAERVSRKPLTKAVITVPAYFNQLQKQSTREAAREAGLEVLELITEPAAAAYAYGFDRREFDDYNLLVFDLGGGTFDVVVIKVSSGHFRVVSIGGDTHLGGRDFDNLLMEYVKSYIEDEYAQDCFTMPKRRQKLLAEVIAAKESLSHATSTEIFLGQIINDLDYDLVLTRQNFDTIVKSLYDKIEKLTREAIRDAKMSPNDIHEILLIGGSSRIPAVRELLAKIFPGKKLNDSLNPDEAVAYGAALRAAQLSEATKAEVPNIHLIEATPLSLGVMVTGDRYSVIVKKNSSVPVSEAHVYRTAKNDQYGMDFEIYEGERPLVQHNNFLGTLSINGIPPGMAGSQSATVTFDLDRNGILTVTARHKGISKTLSIDYGEKKAGSKTIDQMLREAKLFKEQDNAEFQRQSAKSNLDVAIEKYTYKLTHAYNGADRNRYFAKCDEMREWLRKNDSAPKHIFEDMEKHLEQFCSNVHV